MIEEQTVATIEGESAAQPAKAKAGFRIVRAADATVHSGRKPRAAQAADFALHPAIERGMRMMREETPPAKGAIVRSLFNIPTLSIAYAWFKSGYPLPLHSHDVDCYYQIIAGELQIGTETIGKGDGLFVPAGVPYTVTPGPEGAEFLEIRTSPL